MPTPESPSRTRRAWRSTRGSGWNASASTSASDTSSGRGTRSRGTGCAWPNRTGRRLSRSRSGTWALDSRPTREFRLRNVDELLSIGRFARLSGLSVGALRHYHEVGLLEPARVDPETSYRSYARSQLDDARLIGRLRELGLGLPEIRAILGADAAGRSRSLAAHRSRLMGLLARLQRQIHWLNQAIDHEEPIMTTPPMPPDLDARTIRQLAAGLFNHTWT